MVATVVVLPSSAVAVIYYERDAYYARNDPEHRQASFWHGEAAQALGLRAHVRPSRFESVLSGYVPGTDLRLGRMREGEHVHQPGWDITLSAPKSVSLEALVMGDRRVIRAHDEAVRATLDFVEAELLQTRGWDPATRRRPRVKANGMVVAGFRHLASRDQDPQLHTHCVLANMTRTASGEWRSVEPTKIRRSQKLIGAYYRNELARRVQALGMADGPGLLLSDPELADRDRLACPLTLQLAPPPDRPARRALGVAAQPFLAQYDASALRRPDHNLVPAPQPHPQRRRVARPIEAARSDPAHIAEADILLDVPPAFDFILGERPAVFHADLRHLVPRIHERDPTFDPGRPADPGDHGRPESGPDRARHPRLGVIVFAAHPDAVLPVTVRHRMLPSVLTRLDPGDEDFPDRFAPGVPDLEPVVLEDLVQFRHPAVDPAHVPPRLQRPKHEHRNRIFLTSIPDRNILPPVAARPPVALLFENVHRLADPRSAGPDTPAADRPPDCRLVHPDARRGQRVPRSGQCRPDPLDVARPE